MTTRWSFWIATSAPGGQQFGNLTPLEVRRQGVGGVIGLDRPYGLAVSGGARRNIYAASLGGQSVTAFVRRSGSSCPAAGGGNLAEPVFIAAGRHRALYHHGHDQPRCDRHSGKYRDPDYR